MKIYIESLITTNALMYFVLIFLTKTIFKFEASKFKMFVASFVAGLVSAVLVLPSVSKFEAIFIQMILMLFLASFCYKNMNIKKMIVSVISFVILSNVFYSILNITNKFKLKNNTIISSQMPLLVALIILMVLGLVTKFFVDILLTKLHQTSTLVETELEYNNKKISTISLIDTGNNLCFNNAPVSFINFDIFSKLTGITLDQFLTQKYIDNNCEFVDVNSLGGRKKLLLLKLNKIKIKINNKYKIINAPQVAVSLKILKKEYKMILNHNIL